MILSPLLTLLSFSFPFPFFLILCPAADGGGGGYRSMDGGLLAVHLDNRGTTVLSTYGGTECVGDGSSATAVPNNLVIRGPTTTLSGGTNSNCVLGSTGPDVVNWTATATPASRLNSGRRVRIVMDPPSYSSPQITVYYSSNVSLAPTQVLQVPVPTELQQEQRFRWGIAANTVAGFIEFHEVSHVLVQSLLPLPAIAFSGSISLADATPGVAYSATIATANGMAPITFSISSGSLPPGLSVAASVSGANAVISGTVSTSTSTEGTYSFIITAVDGRTVRSSVSQAMTLVVLPGPSPSETPSPLSTPSESGSVTPSLTAMASFSSTRIVSPTTTRTNSASPSTAAL